VLTARTLDKTSQFACPVCATGTVLCARIPYDVAFRGRDYQVPSAEVMLCDSCAEVFFAPGQSDALQRIASDIARVDMGLVPGAEIVQFRKALGLTQAELEEAIGVPAKTVARWEIGSVLQSRAADRFLRLLMAHPALVAELLEREETRANDVTLWNK
jgi:putative zinc finger/helix-turn-helix YgiT family protein